MPPLQDELHQAAICVEPGDFLRPHFALRAPQVATLQKIVTAAATQCGAIVSDRQVADAPPVAMDELALRRAASSRVSFLIAISAMPENRLHLPGPNRACVSAQWRP